MAKVIKCDRCGSYYDNNTTPTRKNVNNGRVKGVDIMSTANYTDEVFDLCDECLKKFYEWMENKEDSKETNLEFKYHPGGKTPGMCGD